MKIGSVVVDFDGTACSHDAADHLLREFADGDWRTLDEAWERGELGSREAVSEQSAMLDADRATMLDYVARHCPMDPTFAPFVRWARRWASTSRWLRTASASTSSHCSPRRPCRRSP